jgi:DNA-binding NtrC family response regulator
MSGLELLPKAKALRPDVPVIMITQRCKVDGPVRSASARSLAPYASSPHRNEIDLRVEEAAQLIRLGRLL